MHFTSRQDVLGHVHNISVAVMPITVITDMSDITVMVVITIMTGAIDMLSFITMLASILVMPVIALLLITTTADLVVCHLMWL